MNLPDQQTARRIVPQIAFKLLLVLVLFIASISIFGFIVHEVLIENEVDLDQHIHKWVDSFKTDTLIQFMRRITFFGSSYFLLPAYCLLIIFFFLKRRKSLAIDIGIIGLSSTLFLHSLKFFFKRGRPESPLISPLRTFSFPSGHALSSFIFCSVLVYIIWKTEIPLWLKWLLSLLLICFSLLIGVSRIMLNMHYPSDVIAGISLGLAWVLLSFWLLEKMNARSRKKQIQ
ncbi:MAG TPA: phosphatase PAP2 family protein [Flavitalea sp.]|nr:phosphatase PAP2 family protein [Flavitalea sp.]